MNYEIGAISSFVIPTSYFLIPFCLTLTAVGPCHERMSNRREFIRLVAVSTAAIAVVPNIFAQGPDITLRLPQNVSTAIDGAAFR